MLSAAHSIYLGINSSFVWSKGEKVKEDGEKSCSREGLCFEIGIAFPKAEETLGE